jgi:hypothetical protein
LMPTRIAMRRASIPRSRPWSGVLRFVARSRLC